MKKHILIVFFIAGTFAAFGQAGCISGHCDDGNGTYRFDNGDTYTGEWKGGNRTGYGRYDWADGSYYVGYFSGGLLEGEGGYYSTDGTKMVGFFKNNEYLGETDPNAGATKSDDYSSDDSDDSWDSLDSLLDALNAESDAADAAKAAANKNARQADFGTVVTAVIKDFANNFEDLKGTKEQSSFSFGDSWYSNLMVNGTTDAIVSATFLGNTNTWYNVLYEGTSYESAKFKYDDYVSQFNKSKVGCCTLVYDTNDYKGDSYESYTTYWLTFLVNDGYDEAIYKDLLVEIELSKKIAEDGWEVLIRVSHESSK